MEANDEDIVIVGGGIAGLSIALALHRLGLKTLVLESSNSYRVSGAALTIWNNGWKALDVLGVASILRPQHCLLARIVATSATSGLPVAQHPSGHQEARCVKRKVLLETLAKDLPSDTVRFSSKVVSIEKSGCKKLLHLADGSTLKTKVLIGCDGVNSVVASWLGFKKPSYTNRFGIRGYVDFEDNHGLKPEFFQIYGNGWRCGIIPCNWTCVYWFFVWSPSTNQDEEMKDNPMKMKQFVLSHLEREADETKAIIEKTKQDEIICSPLGLRLPWEIVWGDITKDNVCVAGDAFHPMTPDLGQGAGASLEDGVILARYLAQAFSMNGKRSEHIKDFEKEEYRVIEISLNKYAKERRWRAIDLVTTSYFVGLVQQGNGKVMQFCRDKVLAPFLIGFLFNKADFDCGSLGVL